MACNVRCSAEWCFRFQAIEGAWSAPSKETSRCYAA